MLPMAVQAMRAGALDFIEKPIGREELITGIERALMESCLAMGDLALIRRRPARATRPLGDSFQPNRNARSRYQRRSREIRRAKPNHSASRYSIAAIDPVRYPGKGLTCGSG